MIDNAAKTGASQSTIAIAQEDNKFKAVELKRQNGAFEVLWVKSSEISNKSWSSFAAECGLSAVTSKQAKPNSDRIGVVGFDSTDVAFYRIDTPAIEEDEIEAVVKMQAETILPLPIGQMELAWRRGSIRDGKIAITIAAARREPLNTLVNNVRGFEPARILLDCEAIVRVWKAVFSGGKEDALIVSLAARRTQVCLAEKGRLSSGIVLDTGLEDFLAAFGNPPSGAELPEQTEIAERFSQDIRSVLESFDNEHRALPVFVLSDGSSAIDSVAACLKAAGINAKAVVPDVKSLQLQGEFGVSQVYEYRLPIGLALMSLEQSADGLNLFANLYDPSGIGRKRSSLYSLKMAGVVTAALMVMLAIVSYGLDVAENNRLAMLVARPDFKELFERQVLIENIARQRPDLLQLLSDINSGENRGIQLDNFYFRKGQPITIGGEAQSNDQLYDFQKLLLSKNGVSDVNIQNTSTDSRTKRLRFTITFHYKTFTKKSTQTQSRRSEIL